jgi:hypothetical protein
MVRAISISGLNRLSAHLIVQEDFRLAKGSQDIYSLEPRSMPGQLHQAVNMLQQGLAHAASSLSGGQNHEAFARLRVLASLPNSLE